MNKTTRPKYRRGHIAKYRDARHEGSTLYSGMEGIVHEDPIQPLNSDEYLYTMRPKAGGTPFLVREVDMAPTVTMMGEVHDRLGNSLRESANLLACVQGNAWTADLLEHIEAFLDNRLGTVRSCHGWRAGEDIIEQPTKPVEVH